MACPRPSHGPLGLPMGLRPVRPAASHRNQTQHAPMPHVRLLRREAGAGCYNTAEAAHSSSVHPHGPSTPEPLAPLCPAPGGNAYLSHDTPARWAAGSVALPIGLSDAVATALGVPIGLAGLALYLWTLVLFARAKGAQIPVVPTVCVVSTGPYSYTRNPMQTSAVFMAVGAGVAMNSWSFILGGLMIRRIVNIDI